MSAVGAVIQHMFSKIKAQIRIEIYINEIMRRTVLYCFTNRKSYFNYSILITIFIFLRIFFSSTACDRFLAGSSSRSSYLFLFYENGLAKRILRSFGNRNAEDTMEYRSAFKNLDIRILISPPDQALATQ